MSGGYFDHGQFQIQCIIDGLKSVIWNNGSKAVDGWGNPIHYRFSPETIYRFKKAVIALEKAYIEAQRADWLISGDDGEDTYHKRLEHDHRQLREALKTIQWQPEEGSEP